MRSFAAITLAVVACLVAGAAPAAAADTTLPRSAAAFRDSVGVTTHIVYFDTPYGDWERVVDRLDELGVRHLRDGANGNPGPEWRDWNERYYRAVELAADRGMRFLFEMGRPGNRTGTLDELLAVVGGRLRRATEALEAPNEFDHFNGGPRWPAALRDYTERLYRGAKAHPALRSLPVLGPSLGTWEGPRRAGDHRAWLDRGNIHPYTGGASPSARHVRSELARASAVSGDKPVWATEAGFHNALHAKGDQPPTSEAAAAVYLVRTFLEHFEQGIARTYAYELVDNRPDPGLRDPVQHFGLLRHDFSPKPAFTALKNLLAAVGRDDRAGRLRPLRLSVSAPADEVRRLVLQRADGTHLVALWRQASVWDRKRRRSIAVAPRTVRVSLPDATKVTVADPVAGSGTSPVALRRGRARLQLGARPLLLEVSSGRSGAARSR
jgi:hypothetical protein